MLIKLLMLTCLGFALAAIPLNDASGQPRAQAFVLTAEQTRSMGVRFMPVSPAETLEVGTHARVVFRTDAQYVVAAPYAGMVTRIVVSIGQKVTEGQPLATFVSPQLFEASRALTEATSQARLAQQALARDHALYDDGIIAASRWQATQARAVEASAMAKARQADIASAGIALTQPGNEAQLVSRRGGIVSEVSVVPGARVEAAAPLFRIVDPSALELDLLFGRDLPVPTAGDQVDIVRRGASGTVIGIAPTVDGTAGVRVRASLERRGDLRVGESINVTVRLRAATGKHSHGLLRVPAAAVAYVRGVPGLFVATERGVRFQEVTVASTDDSTAVVQAPLPAEARVAVEGVGALKGLLAGEQ